MLFRSGSLMSNDPALDARIQRWIVDHGKPSRPMTLSERAAAHAALLMAARELGRIRQGGRPTIKTPQPSFGYDYPTMEDQNGW